MYASLGRRARPRLGLGPGKADGMAGRPEEVRECLSGLCHYSSPCEGSFPLQHLPGASAFGHEETR